MIKNIVAIEKQKALLEEGYISENDKIAETELKKIREIVEKDGWKFNEKVGLMKNPPYIFAFTNKDQFRFVWYDCFGLNDYTV